MKQIIDRIAASLIGIIILIGIEGMFTLGSAFDFEHYSWKTYTCQLMIVYLVVWVSNKIYDETKKD